MKCCKNILESWNSCFFSNESSGTVHNGPPSKVIISPNFSFDLSAKVRNSPFFTREFGYVITKTSNFYPIGIPQGVKDINITAIGRDGKAVSHEVK